MPSDVAPSLLNASKRTQIRRALLGWYRKNKRSLPWREDASPYSVWVSEVMLQQTRVEVVRDYYQRWMARFPRLNDLAQSNEDEVLRLWQGLGYYSRARRLRQGAQFVVDELEGELPSDPAELQKIPGIGPYSAGAISSIAFGKPSPIVDGNVIRVLTRLFALGGDPAKAKLKKQLWELAGELVPSTDASDFNQALMEFGALVCTPRSPACHACPARRSCLALDQAEVTKYPQLPQKTKPTPLSMVVVILRKRGRYLITKLPEDARWWAGLEALPFDLIQEGESPKKGGLRVARKFGRVDKSQLELMPVLTHTVTRFKISLHPVVLELAEAKAIDPAIRWVPRKRLFDLALPAPHKKALQKLGI